MLQNIWCIIKNVIYKYPPSFLTLPAFYQLVCYTVLKKPCARQFSPIKQRRLFGYTFWLFLWYCRQSGERLGESHLYKMMVGAVPSIIYIRELTWKYSSSRVKGELGAMEVLMDSHCRVAFPRLPSSRRYLTTKNNILFYNTVNAN